uniref:Smoothelin domain-containing protein n=1 Tax=Timema douglasi TaxID=61478 RepID=A0A7R8VFZ3_TIMDO|nr:unnamed protein product [Timema douglasi]
MAEWQQTEDFGRKKEIRARMYKLREQRLKEFYTTGEVLHDVLSSTSSLDDSSAVRQVKSGSSNTRYHSSSDISSSQKKDQVVSKNSSYTTSSSIRHADSLNDDSFLTLKSKEIRDSESPTREFHKKQEKNVSDDGGYWRVVQESSSGAYEESGTIRDGVEATIHSKYKTEQRKTAGDSTDGLSTTTRVSSSQETANIPSDGNSQNESSISTCVVLKGGDIGGDLISSNSTSQSGKWSSTSSSSFVTQNQQKEQMNSTSSSSRAISSSIQTGQDISSHYILDSSNSGKDDSSLIKELSTSVSEIGQNISDVSSKRVTQRSQTSDLIIDGNLIVSDCDRVSTTGKNTNVIVSTSIDRSPLIDNSTIIDFNISMNDTLTTGTSVSEEKSSKVVEQRIMSELHKLDSFLLTQNATDSTPVSPHDARDSASWTIVSSTSKHRNGQDVSDQVIIDEFVFQSGNADNIKDTTNLQSKEFINQEKNSSLIVTNEKVLNDKETKIYVDGTPQKIVHNTGKSPTEELKGTSNLTSNQETTTAKPSEGQYITTYKQDYTNKRISVDVSPTHEAFARSLRTSPEHGTPNSTRSSSKVSLDRSSPEKSPSKSPYRNRTSADNSLSSPSRSSPEKSAVRPSSARSSPEKINKTYPLRISPEKTGPTNISSQKTQSISSPDKISSPRLSPDKFTTLNSERTVPGRISPEKSINKIPATRVSPESATTSARWSPDRKSPQKDTINKTNRSSPARCSPEKMMPDSEKNTQTGKLQRQPERRVSSVDRPREPNNVYSPTRKLSDSTRITITNKDNNVQTASVKERRKFSSGATRTSTKKRSSTPGVSPSLSPSREDNVNLRVRQSRPRSRGSSKSTTETEDSDYETKGFENLNEVKLDKQLKKQPCLINTKLNKEYVNSTKKSEEVEITTFDDENYELEINRNIPYHDVSDDKEQTYLTSPCDNTSELVNKPFVNVNTTKPKALNSTTKKPHEMPSQDFITTEKQHAIDKVLSSNTNLNTTPEASVRSAQSSPERKIPARPNESPKSVLDKLTRDKSPEYSSEGSLIHELSYKQNDEKSAFTQVKQKNDLHRESLGSSPERNSFTPIKVFKTTPETSSQQNEPADKTKTSPSTAKSPVQQSSVTFPSKTAESLKTVCPIPKKGQDMPTDREPIKPDKPLSSRPEYFQEKDTSTQQYYKDTKQITTLDNDDSLSSCDYLKQNEKPSQLLQETSKPNTYNIVDEHPDNIDISPKGYIPAKDSRKPEMQNTKNFIENEIQESQKVSGKYDKTIKKSRRSTNSDSKSSSISPCSSSPERPKITTGTSRVEITLRPTPKGNLSKNSLPQNERPVKEIPVTGHESPQKRFTTTKQVASPIRNKPKRPAIDSDETPDSSPERTPRGKIITKTPSKIRLLRPDKNNDAASRLPSKPSVTSVKTNSSPRSEQNKSAPIKKDKPFERKLSDKSISSLSRVSDRPQNQRTNKVITRIPSSTDSSLRQGRTPEKSSEVFRSKKDIQQITKLPTNVQYSVDIIHHKNYSVRKPESSPEGRSPSLSPERVILNSSSRYPSYKRSPITSPERQITPKTTKTVDDNRSNIPKRTSQFPSPDRHTRIPIQGKHTKSPTSSRYPADIIRKPSDHISEISVQNKPKDTLDQPSPRTSHKLDNSRAHYSSPSSSPDRTQQRITRFKANVKVNPVVKNVDTAKESRLHKTRKSPDDIDDRSTDRSSTLSSPETVKTAEDIVEELNENVSEKRKLTEIYLDNLPEKRDLSPSNKEKGVPTPFTNNNNDYFESSTSINNRAHTLRQDTYDVNQHSEYITDDYDVDNVQDETPPEEFIVDDDSPVHPAPKLSSIPMRKQNLNPNQPYIEKSPLTKQIKSKPKPEKNITVPRTKIIITTKSIPIKDVRNLNSLPISTKPTREVSTVLHQRSEPRVPLRRDQSTANQSPRKVSTKDTKISRVNSDKNVIKHHITSPSNIQPNKHPSKSDVTVSNERNKISSVTAHISSTRQKQPTTKNVTSTKSSGIKNTKSTITIQRPVQKPMVSKEEPNRRPMSIAIASTKRTTVTKEKISDKKHLNTKKIVPTKEHNTSPFFSEDEQEMPDIVDSEDRERFSEQEDDETDQEYIKELEDLRQTEEQSYASKVTHIKNREDRLLSTIYNGKKTSDSLTTIQIQLPKSSRESSPEYSRRPLLTTDDEDSTGPRYADKVSEPDDDDDSPKKKPPAVFRKPILHPVPLSEEYTDEEEPDLRPIRKEQPVKLNKGEHYDEFPHSQIPIEKRHTEKIVDRPVQYVGTPKEDDNIFLQLEKVTDLDEESDTDEALKSVSVANRVSLFLEEAKKTTVPHKSPQLVEENKKPMDSPTSVRKAKLMFENIAHTQKSPVKSPQSPRKNIPDIIDRPSVFEARRGGKVTSPVKDDNFIRQEREFTEKQDESNYYDHSRRTSHPNDEKHTREDIPIKPLVTKHKTIPTAPSDDEDDFDDTESFTQDEIKQSRRPSSTQEHPSDSKSFKPQPTSKLSNRSISPALKKMEYQHYPKDAAPIALKPSGTTRRPSYTSPEVSNEQTISRDDLPSTKISSDTYTRRKASFPDKVVSPNARDVAPGQKMSSNKHYNEKTLSSEHPVHRRPSTPSHKDYSHENKIPKEAKPSSPARTTNFKPRAESPPRKISTDTIIRKISTPKEVPTEAFNKRQPTSSNKPREISPVNKISTVTLTRRKPTSPDRSIEEPSKICTDTYSRGKPKYPEQTVDKNYGTYTKVRPSTKQESAGKFDTFTMKGKSIGKKDVPEDENKTISKDYISRKESSPVNFNSEPKKGYLQDTFSSRKHAHEDLSSDEDASKRNDFILRKTVDDSFEILPGEFPEDSHFYADTNKEPTIGYLQDTLSSRKHARDDSQSDDETTHGRDSLPRKMPENICSTKIVDDFPEDRHFHPRKTRRDVSPADKDTSSTRRYSKDQPTDITTKQYSPTWKGASPTRETLSKKEQSPARDYPRRDYSPSSKKSPSPSPTRRDFTHRASSPAKKDSITRRESAHRPENTSSLRKESLPKEKPKSLASKYLAKVEQKFPLKTVDIRPGGKFGVSLRQTNVTTSTLQRRQSGDVTKTKSCAPNGEEVIVEDIFDLELLEMMLERAVLYDERSAIRAQIRIVRRTMSESTTTTTTTTKMTKSTSSVEATQRLSGREAPRLTGDRDSPRRRGSHERPDEAETGRRPSSGYEPDAFDKPRASRRSPERPGDAEPRRKPSSGYEPNTSDKPRAWRRSPERPGDAEPRRRPSSGYEPNTSDKPQAWRRSPERPGDAEPERRPSSGYEPNTSDKTRTWRRSPERPGDAEPGRRPSSGYEPNTSDKPRAWRRSPEGPGDAEPGRRPSSGYEPNTSDKTRTWRRSPERPGDVEPGRRPSSGYEPNTSDKPRARKSSPITQRFFPEEGRRRPSQDKGSGDQYLENKPLFVSSYPSRLCPPSVVALFTRAAGNLETEDPVPAINPCRHRTTRKENPPWPASVAELPRQSSPQRASPSRNAQEPGEKTPITKKTSHTSVEPKTAASQVAVCSAAVFQGVEVCSAARLTPMQLVVHTCLNSFAPPRLWAQFGSISIAFRMDPSPFLTRPARRLCSCVSSCDVIRKELVKVSQGSLGPLHSAGRRERRRAEKRAM